MDGRKSQDSQLSKLDNKAEETSIMEEDTPVTSSKAEDLDDIEKAATSLSSIGQALNDRPNENVVDWDGPEDALHPRNWSNWKKTINIVFISSMTFLTPLASSMFAPGVPEVMREFDSDNVLLATFVVSSASHREGSQLHRRHQLTSCFQSTS